MKRQIFYDGEIRFTRRIKKQWEANGFKYNQGHIQLLKYSWRTRLYWGVIRSEKISEENKVDITLRIF